jgi:hypothetical protein
VQNLFPATATLRISGTGRSRRELVTGSVEGTSATPGAEVNAVTDEHQVPPSVEQSEDRIKGRDYESDFARLPDHETHPVETMGSGPSGPVATANGPIILMAIGGLIALSVFLFQSPWVLILGLAIFLGAAIWAGVANRGPGSMGGTGPSVVEPEDASSGNPNDAPPSSRNEDRGASRETQ